MNKIKLPRFPTFQLLFQLCKQILKNMYNDSKKTVLDKENILADGIIHTDLQNNTFVRKIMLSVGSVRYRHGFYFLPR